MVYFTLKPFEKSLRSSMRTVGFFLTYQLGVIMSDVMPFDYSFETIEAIGITWVTCVGANNCFSVKTANGKEYRVVNFYLETLEELLQKDLTWPIKISLLSDEVAVVNDERILDKHYRPDFCSTCTPTNLLPLPQRLHKYRAIRRGASRFKEIAYMASDGTTQKMLTETTVITADPKLKTIWSMNDAQ